MTHDMLDGDAWPCPAGVGDVVEDDCFSDDCGGCQDFIVAVVRGEGADVGVDEAEGGIECVWVDSDPWGSD